MSLSAAPSVLTTKTRKDDFKKKKNTKIRRTGGKKNSGHKTLEDRNPRKWNGNRSGESQAPTQLARQNL